MVRSLPFYGLRPKQYAFNRVVLPTPLSPTITSFI